jgi:hypothetical protein
MTKNFILCFILLFIPYITTSTSSNNTSTQFVESVYDYEKQWKLNLNRSFLCKLAEIESGNRYTVVNSYGYMGAYQFSLSTLRLIGVHTSRSEFLSNPELQDLAAIKLMEANKKTLQPYIDRYHNKRVHGYLVTEAGLLAAAHLVGAYPVIRFLRTGHTTSDGYGTNLTRYLRIFKHHSVSV